MKQKTIKEFINSYEEFYFIKEVKENTKLEMNQYFILVVMDYNYPDNNSPHVKAIDAYTEKGFVGIEKSSGENNYYISKDFEKRKSYRGRTCIVRVKNKNHCIDLTI